MADMDRVVRINEVMKLTSLSRVEIWRRRQAGDFPQAFRIGKRDIGWRLSAIEAWIDDRPAA